ncbi:MAG: hypothetical protein RIG62_23630 [Cyclobacteriaceae bacterium]
MNKKKCYRNTQRQLRNYLLMLMISLPLVAPAQKIDMDLLQDMKPRSIGPAGMSGRVTAFDVVISDPDIIYAGTGAGGLWKSENGGLSWEPIFDKAAVASIGSIAINQQNPNEIWVGTGEGNPRNSQSSGNGVYKSIDGGRTWKHLGLDDTRNIHRIYINSQNPDIVYAGVQGTAWADSPDRGVYRTMDGGTSWEKVLYVNERTGIADMVIDPENPNKLIAGMWEFRRWPWFFKSGGEGSGIYVSFDAGSTWEKRTEADGLPAGEIGKIGLAIAPSNPDVVYAYVESKSNAIYRSADGGFSWKKTSKDKDELIGNRPFYYADLFVDTQNENRLYSLASYVTVSEDGAKTFERFVDRSFIHVDNHAWWSHPDDPDFLLLGNDGGMAISRDRGKSWHFPENLALGQFYHINVDMEVPYNVYGGLQDNGSWKGPSQVWRESGIMNAYWTRVGGGDGFDVVPDPLDNRYGYAMSQGGNLLRYDTETGGSQRMKPVHPDGTHLRFNWNTGFAMDPHDKKTLYYGSQFLLKSSDNGSSWDIISPDLTTDDPEKQQQRITGGLTIDNSTAENYTTIISIAPSPLEKGVIWVGTDDGNVQLTQDGGENWTKLNSNIKELPANSWVTQIQASAYDPATAFVVLDNHRNNDWTPYIFKTTDYGKSWERLVDNEDVWGYALSVVQDPVEPKLLFCGTEFGLYVSIDEGGTWTQWAHDYPTVSTMDLVIHPREHDLVIGTFGRSVFVLDDIRPLRAMAQTGYTALLDKPLEVFEAPDAYLASIGEMLGYSSVGHGLFFGENRPYGALISYYLKDVMPEEESDNQKSALEDSVKIMIMNSQGETVRTMYQSPQKGINRLAWALGRDEVREPDKPKPEKMIAAEGGFSIAPGEYTAQISYGEHQGQTKLLVKPDPRVEVSEDTWVANEEMIQRYLKNVKTVTASMDQLNEAQASLDLLSEQLKKSEDEKFALFIDRGKALKDTIQDLKELIIPKEIQGFSRDPELLLSRLGAVETYLRSPMNPPLKSLELAMLQAEESMEAPLAQIAQFFQTDWENFKNDLEGAQVPVLPVLTSTESVENTREE